MSSDDVTGMSERLFIVTYVKSYLQIIAANKEAKKTSAVLDSDGDTFLKNECKADKWLIIELSQVTKMDTLVLSQVILWAISDLSSFFR